MNKFICLLSASLFSVSVQAQYQTQTPKCPGVHTWHKVSTQSGQWHGTVTIINQKGGFVDENCQEISNFEITPENSFNYGMYFLPGADFNFTYTLALAKQPTVNDESASFNKWPICHYIVSAYGPADPQIYTTPVNNASCDWQAVPGIGENFQAN